MGSSGMSEDLGQLREAIDELDNDILTALSQRMQLSDRVIAAKGGVSAFRPGREAQLVRRLVGEAGAHGLDLSAAVILTVWRQIMAASLGRQNGDITCAVHMAVMPAATWHMGAALAAKIDPHLDNVLDYVWRGEARYALVPADTDGAELAAALIARPQLRIMARTPLYDMPTIAPAFIIADYLPDPSGDDISLFVTDTDTGGVEIKTVDGYHDTAETAPETAKRLIGIYAR